jgi:uncharacterized protein
MIVGILSDSHGNEGIVSQALRMLVDAGAEAFFHCGDVGGLGVLGQLVGRRTWLVWGNTDVPSNGLHAYLETVGIQRMDAEKGIELDGMRIGMWHGHEPGFRPAVDSGAFDYIFCGHTHAAGELRRGRTRIINPGALHRAPIKTVATLDLSSDNLCFHIVNRHRQDPMPSVSGE